MAAERGDRIDDDQRTVLAGDRRKLLHRIEHARRGFGVNDRDHVRPGSGECGAECVRVARAAPFDLEACHLPTVALTHLREAIAEVPADDHENPFPWFYEIRDHGLHAGGAGARDREGKRAVRRTERPLQSLPHIIEQREHQRVEVAYGGRRHGAHYAGRGQARARTEENSIDVW